MGLTGFNRARRRARLAHTLDALKIKAPATADEDELRGLVADAQAKVVAEGKAPFIDPEPTQAVAADEPGNPGQVDGDNNESKADLRARADEIAERLGMKKPAARATVLDLQAFIEQNG
jgi:hypothetical protein